GHVLDGHDFIEKAIANGAPAVVVELLPKERDEAITWIKVHDMEEALAEMAAKFFDKPSQHLTVIGITGTNGKTSTAFMTYQLLNALGRKCGMISTIDVRLGDEIHHARLTTPDVISVNRWLDKARRSGCTELVMEASSHALDQGRLKGVRFSYAVFTNISHDHLDYHKDMKSYIFAKKILFDDLQKNAKAIINKDDKRGEVMVQNTRAAVVTYSLQKLADYKARIIDMDLNGMTLEINGMQFVTAMIGQFNVYNLLAALAIAREEGFDLNEVLQKASLLYPAEGRFEVVRDASGRTAAIIDYAHTPDALKHVLSTINQIKRKKQKVITVVGCGGDRDQQKRPKMAQIASRLSDEVILTSDNPRNEEPSKIIGQMLDGLDPDEKEATLVVEDRRQAIKMACKMRGDTDIILIAGKGHEKYQEIKGERLPFDDKHEVKVYL
ncbi:MAG: UDP-N-acetylmuramoyl-L-alanyl-D-glutamate--2,6-diaminopimelate ligase, partial [Saprospiraceae bacterium]|nr:UDP-N-acetylmuramoyl-L-alanyl-D-glutamate--2,6-diaminopimelate ligase [Saprospiraceae bacterium]